LDHRTASTDKTSRPAGLRRSFPCEHCQRAFGELCQIPVEDDGLILSAETRKPRRSKKSKTTKAFVSKFLAPLENGRTSIQVDVGFGDAVTPRLLDYPTLLPMAAPRIQAYPMNTAVAETLEAIVRLGILNKR
jgi:hypothetical protein